MLKINNKQYNLSTMWYDTTLGQAIDLCSLEIDERKLDVLFDIDYVDGYDEEQIKYMRQAVNIMSKCPVEDLQHVDEDNIIVLWDLIKQVVYSLYYINFDKYKPRGMQSIDFKGVTYSLPSSLNLNNEFILAYEEPSRNIVEVANLVNHLRDMKKDGIVAMKYICAILLKEDKDEIYDEKVIALRAEKFTDLPLSIVLECFFFINYYLHNYLISSINYLPKAMVKELRRNRNILRGFIKLLKQKCMGVLMKLKRLVSGN